MEKITEIRVWDKTKKVRFNEGEFNEGRFVGLYFSDYETEEIISIHLMDNFGEMYTLQFASICENLALSSDKVDSDGVDGLILNPATKACTGQFTNEEIDLLKTIASIESITLEKFKDCLAKLKEMINLATYRALWAHREIEAPYQDEGYGELTIIKDKPYIDLFRVYHNNSVWLDGKTEFWTSANGWSSPFPLEVDEGKEFYILRLPAEIQANLGTVSGRPPEPNRPPAMLSGRFIYYKLKRDGKWVHLYRDEHYTEDDVNGEKVGILLVRYWK